MGKWHVLPVRAETCIDPFKPGIVELGGVRIAAISAGRRHSAIITSVGAVYMFGSNYYHPLGSLKA
jgi:hypothetical protein